MFHLCHGWTMVQPFLQNLNLVFSTTGQHFDRTVWQVNRVAGKSEVARHFGCGRAKEDALHATGYGIFSAFALSHNGPRTTAATTQRSSRPALSSSSASSALRRASTASTFAPL